ncbi:MAG TPA: hypothetical protein VL550_02780 [Rhodocyclaceae bacterium]|jgi:hypothetical protein|nr:hypothetical protein [Rhodocyclaceae bacterium]
MSFLKSFVTRHIHAAAATQPTGQEAVAVFFYGPTPEIARISSLAAPADCDITDVDGKTRITLRWASAETVITIDPTWDRQTQMQGMRGWTERFPKHVRELEGVRALVTSFDTVTACYGTISKPALTAEGLKFLLQLTGDAGGFFFSRNSFYDLDGLRITGFDEDPVWLIEPDSAETNQA